MHPNIHQIKIPNVKNAIGIISGKGGVGKTFIATSLAMTFAKLGKRTAILDADINYPNVFKMLGIATRITPTGDNKIIPVEKWGIKTVSMAGLATTDEEPMMWRGPIVSRIAQQFVKESMWADADILIIDFPTGTTDVTVTLLQNFAIDGVIAVTTPQEVSLLDTKRCLNMMAMTKTPVLGIVENMRGDVFGEGGASRVAETYRLPILGSIPLRKQVAQLCDQGTPPVIQLEELEIIFAKIARFVAEKIVV